MIVSLGAPNLAAARNVLLICVNDLKPALGCYGDPLAKTPHLDRLSARGVRFDLALCNQAVFAPARNALMTGLRPQTIGVYDLGTHFRDAAPDAVTVGQYFKRHGYRVEGLGKIYHAGHGNKDDADTWNLPSWKPKGGGYALAESADARGAAYESASVPDDRYGDGMIAGEAIERLRAAKKRPDQPFFIAVGFLKPHLPFVAPMKYWDLYDRNAFPLAQPRTPPRGAPGYAPGTGGELRQYKNIPAKGILPDDLQRTLLHGYYAATSYMDAQAGRVLAELEKLGLAQITLIVLWGDHGWHLGDHGQWCKHTNYEQAARIPVIVAGPGVKAGANSSALIETVDIYPTLAEAAGLAAPPGLDGRSFMATLRNPAAPHRDHAIHVYPRTAPGKGSVLGRALRTNRHRLIERARDGDHRPLWILVWGSITDVAQALHDAPGIKPKLRVYFISSWNRRMDQAARDYVVRQHPDLWMIEVETTFRGMYLGGQQQDDLGNREFIARHVQGPGALGDLLATKKADIKMGDTPSVLYLLRGDAENPAGESWGGAFVQPDSARPYWTDNPDPARSEGKFPGAQTVNRWREEYLRDWQQRLTWLQTLALRNAYGSPQCSPTPVCVQTGQSSPRNGFTVFLGSKETYYDTRKEFATFPLTPNVSDMEIDKEATTIPEALQPLGYVSAYIGKWHMRGDPEPRRREPRRIHARPAAGRRVPMIVRWPSVTAPGSRCDVPVSNVDFYPSFLAAAGAAAPASALDGESLLSPPPTPPNAANCLTTCSPG